MSVHSKTRELLNLIGYDLENEKRVPNIGEGLNDGTFSIAGLLGGMFLPCTLNMSELNRLCKILDPELYDVICEEVKCDVLEINKALIDRYFLSRKVKVNLSHLINYSEHDNIIVDMDALCKHYYNL